MDTEINFNEIDRKDRKKNKEDTIAYFQGCLIKIRVIILSEQFELVLPKSRQHFHKSKSIPRLGELEKCSMLIFV